MRACRWRVAGRVQAVGFRPFVFRLAARHCLQGWVRNRSGEVEIFAQGEAAALEAFADDLVRRAPPLARPRIAASTAVAQLPLRDFRILASRESASATVHLPPDYYACAECVAEVADTANRRYRYPFINCTECGPRYTLIQRLPYDRANTTMGDYAMCPACKREYEDPLDRRFHAEPIACPVCGPQLAFHGDGTRLAGNEPALAAAVAALTAGKIVAVKGIGGYHLMCDATDASAVCRLRERKRRPHKPLAVMFPHDQALLARCLQIDPQRAALLSEPTRAIVLICKAGDSELASEIAPGLSEIGVMLPYSPLHHLLLDAMRRPVVATSANISGEPVLTDGVEVERRLGHVADAYLHHDRTIQRPADDPVMRVVGGKGRWLRLGRGCAPLELELPVRLARPVLAAGAHMKNTIALGWERRVVISPHIGDLDAPRTLAVFEQSIRELQELYNVRADVVACDAHAGYGSTCWALRSGRDLVKVWHHHAHASALAGEHPEVGRWLVFTWDGVGLGEDGMLWGGEALLGRPSAWERAARMRPFRIAGGERAAREPWRSAAALCWETGHDWPGLPDGAQLAGEAWRKGLNSRATTAVGRLFDAAAALIGLNLYSSFEGQGPMLLEAAAESARRPTPIALPLRQSDGVMECDWGPLVPSMLDASSSPGERAALWHESIATALREQARVVRSRTQFDAIGLAGGVFQNRLLVERASELLAEEGWTVHLPTRVPCNDAALSFGQVVEAAHRQ